MGLGANVPGANVSRGKRLQEQTVQDQMGLGANVLGANGQDQMG